MIEWLGWVATAVFVLSYFCRSPEALRAFQMLGATMWVAYGVLIGASPVVVANLLVLGAAGWTVARAAQARARRPQS
jgi:Bacterial inner membrane protein